MFLGTEAITVAACEALAFWWTLGAITKTQAQCFVRSIVWHIAWRHHLRQQHPHNRRLNHSRDAIAVAAPAPLPPPPP